MTKRKNQCAHCKIFHTSKRQLCNKCISTPEISIATESSVSSKISGKSIASLSSTIPSIPHSCCDNCQRRNINVTFHSQPLASKRTKLNFIHNVSQFFICHECSNFLEHDNNIYKFMWPAMIWSMLKTNTNDSKKFIESWSYIPLAWRHWWLQSVLYTLINNNSFLSAINEDTLNNVLPVFEDVTNIYDKFMNDIKSPNDFIFKSCLNREIVPNVRCPWGCAEFVEKTGYIPLDVAITYLSPQLEGVIVVSPQSSNISHRNILQGYSPYFKTNVNEKILDNPDWILRPCLRFVSENGPCILTCKEHHNGSHRQYIHPPLNPINGANPSKYSDQLATAIPSSRTVHPMKSNVYNNIYETIECHGDFKGLDTLYYGRYPKFDEDAILNANNEALMYHQRSDIPFQLAFLRDAGIISVELYHEKLELYKSFPINQGEINEAVGAGTYVPLTDCIKRIEMNPRTYSITEIKLNEKGEEIQKDVFRPPWPLYLDNVRYIHEDNIRCPIKPIQSLTVDGDCRLLWYLLSTLTWIPTLWTLVAQSVTSRQRWHGWVLKYATTHIIGSGFPPKGCDKNKYAHKMNNSVQSVMKLLDSQYQTDGYSNTKLKECLKSIKKVETAWIGSITDLQSLNLEPCIEIVAIFHKRINESITLTQNFSNDTNTCIFDLIYIGQSTCATSPKHRNWKAQAFVKFDDHWWTQSRDKFVLYHQEPTEINFRDWEVALYRKMQPSWAEEEIRNLYLHHFKGQSSLLCPQHQVCLITCPFNRSYRCQYPTCNNLCKLICPYPRCSILCCRKHANMPALTTIDTNPKRIRKLAQVTNSEDRDNNDDDSHINHHIIVDTLEIQENDEDIHSTYDDNTIFSSDDEENLSTYGFEYETTFESSYNKSVEQKQKQSANEENQDNESESSDIDDESSTELRKYIRNKLYENTSDLPTIPTTHALEQTPEIEISDDQQFIGNHVLLNYVGNLLIHQTGKDINFSTNERSFVQQLVSIQRGKCVPLLYSEATPYPSIFHTTLPDDSIVGALPYYMLQETAEMNFMNIADITSHMRTRIKNPSLLTSSDPRYLCNMFDAINNSKMKHEHSHDILARGQPHMTDTSHIYYAPHDSANYPAKLVQDAREYIRMLQSFVKIDQPNFFVTATCNQKQHFGIAGIRQWEEIRIGQIRNEYIDIENTADEIIEAFQRRVTVFITRAWNRVACHYMNWIVSTPDGPLGEVTRFWWRFEHGQDNPGNLPHIHGLFCTKQSKTNPEELKQIFDQIRCSTQTIVRNEEIVEYIEKHFIESIDDVEDIRADFHQMNNHICYPSRCHLKSPDGTVQCRVPNFSKNNDRLDEYYFKNLTPQYNDTVIELFLELKMAEYVINDEGESELIFHNLDLQPGRYYYPADTIEHIVPHNSRMFLLSRSQGCVEVNDGGSSARYIGKYVGGIDKNHRIIVKAEGNTHEGKLVVTVEEVPNTKISRHQYAQARKDAEAKKKGAFIARPLGVPEMINSILGHATVHTNQLFVNIPSLPREQRAGYAVTPIIRRKQPGITYAGGALVNETIRKAKKLPSYRQLTTNQCTVAYDVIQSNVTIDKITVFSLRPPELLFVNSPTNFLCWTTRMPYSAPKQMPRSSGKGTFTLYTSNKLLHEDIMQSGFVDALDYQIKIKPQALPLMLQLESCTDKCRELILKLYACCLQHNHIQPDTNLMLTTSEKNIMKMIPVTVNDQLNLLNLTMDFNYKGSFLPLPLFRNIRPTKPIIFLVHLLLILGSFETEYEVFQNGTTWIDFFRNAQLISDNDFDDEKLCKLDAINRIAKQFIEQQLMFVPSGSRRLGEDALATREVLHDALRNRRIMTSDIPPFLFTAMRTQADEKLKKLLIQTKESMVTVYHSMLTPYIDLPTIEELMSTEKYKPLQWKPELRQVEAQSTESYNESKYVLQHNLAAITEYTEASKYLINSCIIDGAPGTGKTFSMQIAITYAISKGLTVVTSALAAQRALELAGIHIHQLFDMPVIEQEGSNTSYINPTRLAEQCLTKLKRRPIDVAFLEALDVIAIDELGLISAELFTTLEMVMRAIKRNNYFMGGLLVLSTMDHKQLLSIDGRPFLTSLYAILNFDIFTLSYPIRAIDDSNLQKLIFICRKRKDARTPQDEEDFKKIIMTQCNHVDSWQKVKPQTIRIVSKKKAVYSTTEAYFDCKRTETIDVVSRLSEDRQHIKGSHASSVEASPNTSHSLNQRIKECQNLQLCDHLPLEFTYNHPDRDFTQSQMAYLRKAPTQEALDDWTPFEVLVAPPGTKELPINSLKHKTDVPPRWKRYKVTTINHTNISLRNNIIGERKQFCVQPFVAATIHKSMGSTYSATATQIDNNMESDYFLWLPSQVTVLLSRTRHCSDMSFIGDRKQTADNLWNILQTENPTDKFMDDLIDRKTQQQRTDLNQTPVHQPTIIQRPTNYLLPTNNSLPSLSGLYCYLLVSGANKHTVYIGAAHNLQHRLHQHNTGISIGGASATDDPSLRPWIIVAYFTGFINELALASFERHWQRSVESTGASLLTPTQVLKRGCDIMTSNIQLIQLIHFA